MQTEGSPASIPPESIDIQRLQFLTENYTRLQGLRLVPFGVFFLARPLLGPPQVSWTAPVLPIATFGLFFLIGRYYSRNFGRVQRSAGQRLRTALGVAVVLLILFAALWWEERRTLPISPSALLVALGFAGYYFRFSLKRAPYLGAASLFAIISIWPLTGLADGGAFGLAAPLGDLALGMTFLTVGLLDHRLLVRNLSPMTEDDDENAI